MTEHERSRLEVSRLDRAGTLLLASIALAAIVRVGWGGPIFDLHVLGDVAGKVVATVREGLPIWPVIVSLLRDVRPADVMPLLGTVVSAVLFWYVLALSAEVVLVVADALGCLRTRWLMPVWRLMDMLDRAPLAGPKRFVVAGALAGQLVVRSGMPVQAAPLQAAPPVIVEARNDSTARVSPTLAQVDDQQEAASAPWLIHRVRKGDTLFGLSRRYYGDDGQNWVTFFRGNAGVVMGWADGGRGGPVRLTDPNYILEGCDLAVMPVPGVLEEGPNGEVIYIVQTGDTLSGIASRFGVSLDDLWATNQGAQGPDGRVVDDPDEIWPGVRFQVRPVGVNSLEPSGAEPEAQAQEVAPPTVEAAPVQSTPAPAPVPSTPVQPESPTSEPTFAAPTATPAVPATNGSPVVRPVLVPAERSSDAMPPLWPVAPVVFGGALLAGTLMARRRRRRRPFETDLAYASGRVSAKPAQSLRTHAAGDPAELAAAALLRLATSHAVDDVQVVAVFRDPLEITVTLSAPARERDRLRLLLTAAAAPLARRVTVWATADHDVAVRLEDPRAAELAALDGEQPLLVSIGGLGDGRELLGDWQTLGHLLVVSQPGTDDAGVQLAATVTMLAACQPENRLHFYTCAGPDSALEPLSVLPHQRVVARTPETMREVLAALERGLDTPGEAAAERVLIVGELGDVGIEARASLERVLALGPTQGLRVLSASTDLALAGRLAAAYQTRVVYALGNDEDASVRLLGSTDAANLPSDGSMLVA